MLRALNPSDPKCSNAQIFITLLLNSWNPVCPRPALYALSCSQFTSECHLSSHCLKPWDCKTRSPPPSTAVPSDSSSSPRVLCPRLHSSDSLLHSLSSIALDPGDWEGAAIG